MEDLCYLILGNDFTFYWICGVCNFEVQLPYRSTILEIWEGGKDEKLLEASLRPASVGWK